MLVLVSRVLIDEWSHNVSAIRLSQKEPLIDVYYGRLKNLIMEELLSTDTLVFNDF